MTGGLYESKNYEMKIPMGETCECCWIPSISIDLMDIHTHIGTFL
jgi:hypothetical protein